MGKQGYHESVGSMPWDAKSFKPFVSFLAYVAVVLLFIVLIYSAAALVIFPILFLVDPPKEFWQIGLIIGIWILALVITVVAYKTMNYLSYRGRLSRMEKKCVGNILLLSGSTWRSFKSSGNVTFSDYKMSLTGLLGPDLLPGLIMILVFNFVSLMIAVRVGTWGFIGGLGAVIILGLYTLACRRISTIKMASGDISSVECQGPIVQVRLPRPPVKRLKKFKMFISQDFRREFFMRFEQMFPGLLPEEYRKAAMLEAPSVVPT